MNPPQDVMHSTEPTSTERLESFGSWPNISYPLSKLCWEVKATTQEIDLRHEQIATAPLEINTNIKLKSTKLKFPE